MSDEQNCRQSFDDFYHKIKAEVSYDHWCSIWRFISKRQARGEPCLTCNNNGAVGNILNAEPCPVCTPQPAEPVKCRCGATCQDAGDVCRYNEPMEADTEDLIERLLDAQQDINLAANEHMSQIFCDASALIDEIVQVLYRLSTRPQQIQEGWQLVPKEPTEDMLKTACTRHDPESDKCVHQINAYVRYKAMLAAAPKPQGEEDE